MELIKKTSYHGERPLFATHDLRLEEVTIHTGESALKECRNIEVTDCRFEGKYPFWHNDGFRVKNCLFTEGARAALWYSKNLLMINTLVEAPKMFREMDGIELEDVLLPNALETCWNCRNVKFRNVKVDKGDYLFMNGANIDIDGFVLNGNYSFQYCKNVVIRNAEINSKDAFWNTEEVTVYDSVLNGEYLGWHSKNLRLVNCRISGTQPLCYATDLIMENCTMGEDADLCFEYSTLQATINGSVHSVKNPGSGLIIADSYGDIIIDENCKTPGNCEISLRNIRNNSDQ